MTKIKLIFILLFLPFNLPIAQNIISQTEPDVTLYKTQPGFVHNLNNDVLSMYKVGIGFLQSPLHFDSNDFILTGIIAGATTISLTLDNPVRNDLKKSHNLALDNITPFGEKFGNGKYATALSGLLYVGGHILQDDELRKTGLILAETIFLNGLVTHGLKIVTGRSRPYANEGNLDLDFPEIEYFDDEDHSFPSGHTSTAFAVATVLSEGIDNIYASVTLYSLAGLTAFQRIYADRHWFSDTVLGAALGTIIALKVIKLNSNDENANQSSGADINIMPAIIRNGYGVGVALRF
jgi:membrane-associated phospholipid phosphatase